MPNDIDPWLIIIGMAVVTAATRFTGYWLLGGKTLSKQVEDILSAVPPVVLTAIVAPTVLTTGIAESVAGVITIALAWRFPALIAIFGGVFSVVILRYFLSV